MKVESLAKSFVTAVAKERRKDRACRGELSGALVQGRLFRLRLLGPGFRRLPARKRDRI